LKEHRNMILAIVLSAIVLFGWSALTEYYFPAASEPSTKVVDGRNVPVQQRSGSPTGPQAAATAPARVRPAPRVRIETPSLRGSINLRGARIDDLLLTRHRRTIDPNSPPVRLFAPEGSQHAYFGSFGWSGDGLTAPNAETVWRASGDTLAPGRPVTLSWDNGRGQLFEILLAVDDGYMFTAEQRVTNRSAGPIAARPYALINRVGPSPDPDSWTMHVGPVGLFNDTANYDSNWDDVVQAREQVQTSRGGWLGFTDKYWLAAIVPDQQSSVETAFRHNPTTNSFQADFQAPPAIVGPGQAMRYTSRLFAGAKELDLLERYTDEQGVPRLDKAIDWGWFEWFMKPIFSLLTWLFHLIGNFGVAIIALTFIVRLLLFPIAQKQFASMAAMRVLQPKVKLLQERYKEDKPRLQQEMLKLYKEEKVNPMAGCLPILLQIPIWYALYKVLLLAVEMRHEPFALWLRDLSAPDPLTPINLFGFLAFQPPSIIAIGVLPILVAFTMWLQMRLNPAPMDEVQKQVFAFMPWVLMVVMAPFAAGLQLYWLTGNILTIAQQKWLYSRYPGLKNVPASAAAAAPAAAAAGVVADATGGGGKSRRKKK
jgi:YidC/Oxa1 family membrane protein insertase